MTDVTMVAALREAERFMAYFAGETDNYFEGSGSPKACLAQIRAALFHDSVRADVLRENLHHIIWSAGASDEVASKAVKGILAAHSLNAAAQYGCGQFYPCKQEAR